MERKIGEIFEYNGEWYQCLESNICRCDYCDYGELGDCNKIACASGERSDDKEVHFKKLEKVGEPVTVKGRTFQKLILDDYSCANCVFNVQNKECNKNRYIDGLCADNGIWVEIKQIKEDMEEKKLNLKPFDIQKAREGKPVCTKDGRSARIVCFDRNDLYPIVALIECEDGKEMIGAYSKEGCTEIYEIKGTDLMMLPEKKEGWVNVYKDSVYDTKDEALIGRSESRGYIDTIKINWSE